MHEVSLPTLAEIQTDSLRDIKKQIHRNKINKNRNTLCIKREGKLNFSNSSLQRITKSDF
jgi:hypothetical protein